MKKFDLPLITDTIFYTAACWLVCVGLLRWLDVATWACFTAATLIALAVGAVLFLLLSGRHRKRALSRRQQEEKEKLMLHLTLERDEAVRTLLLEALRADGKEVWKDGDRLLLDGTPLIPVFTMQPISADTVAHLLKEYGKAPFLLACNEMTPEAERLLSSFSRSSIRGEEIYDLCKRTEHIPATMICGKIPRRTLRAKLRRTFSKRNAYPFFVSGAGLLVMSLFVFFPVYYLISGSILLVVSVLIRIFGAPAQA